MPDTPGQVAYTAWRADILGVRRPPDYAPWEALHPAQRHAWEVAAQAVQPPPQHAPVCATCQMPYTWKCACDCDAREEDDHA